MKRVTRNTKPHSKSWRTAKAYYVDFTSIYLRKINQRLPVSGGRICWAVVGRKHVRICLPVCNTKFRMRRSEWDMSPVRGIS